MIQNLVVPLALVCAPPAVSEVEVAVWEWGISPRLAEAVFHAARHEDLSPGLVFRLISVESRFDSAAVSRAGAVGLMQLLPSTAGVGGPALVNPRVNLRLGAAYLRELLDRYRSDVRLALLAYNRGPTRVSRLVRRGVDPANGYADRVLN